MTEQGEPKDKGEAVEENLPENPEADAQPAADAAKPEVAESAKAGEAAELKDRLLRVMAEMENLRRRSEREREDTAKYAVTGLARDLLNVADNLRRALENATDALRQDAAAKQLIEGIEITERDLLAAFEKQGIKRIDPVGEKFDHNFHQAMFEVDSAEHAPGTIATVVQPGYVIKDRLLRPALVGVAKGGGAKAHVDTSA